jgi:colicin import membrane protein
MSGVLREYSGGVLGSIGLHGLLAIAVIYAANWAARPTPSQLLVLPIEAALVDARALQAAQAREHATQEAAALLQSERAAEQHLQTVRARQQAEREVAAAEAARQEALAKAQADAAEKRARQEDAARKAEADAAAAADRVRELKRQMAAEERASALQASPAGASYIASLQNKITQAWLKPASAKPGVVCKIAVTQVPGGEVVKATVTACNGDAAVWQSIENAVYRASPLPMPSDPALFQRTVILIFKPHD